MQEISLEDGKTFMRREDVIYNSTQSGRNEAGWVQIVKGLECDDRDSKLF